MGRSMPSATLFRAASMPSGNPSATEMNTATAMSATVSMAFAHKSMNPMNSSPTAVMTSNRQPPAANASSAIPSPSAGQGSQWSAPSMAFSVWVMPAFMGSNSHLPL